MAEIRKEALEKILRLVCMNLPVIAEIADQALEDSTYTVEVEIPKTDEGRCNLECQLLMDCKLADYSHGQEPGPDCPRYQGEEE